jgi:hypothetical protein
MRRASGNRRRRRMGARKPLSVVGKTASNPGGSRGCGGRGPNPHRLQTTG